MNTELDRLVSLWDNLATTHQFVQYVTDEDREVFRSRAGREGLPYLTVELPRHGKLLDATLQSGMLPALEGVSYVEGSDSPTPRFLSKAWKAIVNDDGILVEGEDVWRAVACVRQLTLMFYKLELPFKTESVSTSVASWLQTEKELADLSLDSKLWSSDHNLLVRRARSLVCRLLYQSDPHDISPKHGSGSSACRVVPWERWETFRYIPRLAAEYPYDSYFYLSHNHLTDELGKLDHAQLIVDTNFREGLSYPYGTSRRMIGEDLVRFTQKELSGRWIMTQQGKSTWKRAQAPITWLSTEEEELYSRVVFVHKDSRGPRLISAEPRELMFIQQGLRAKLYSAVQRLPGIAASLDCEDQRRNRIRAQHASVTGEYATLDMKDASDRVSCALVKALFPDRWYRALMASRSQYTRFPNIQGVPRELWNVSIPLVKYAPMGNATTFPVEAICFWAISVAAQADDKEIRRLFSRRLPGNEAQAISHGLPWRPATLVFGDDIIVPTHSYGKVCSALESFGLKVNLDKSFWSGPFRESCGGDFFKGHNTAPVRVKHLPNNDNYNRHRLSDVINNLIAVYGYRHIGPSLTALYESWYGPVATSSRFILDKEGRSAVRQSAGLCIYAPLTSVPETIRSRYNKRFQRREYLVEIESSVDVKIHSDRWSQVLRKTLVSSTSSLRSADWCTLPKRTCYNLGWKAL